MPTSGSRRAGDLREHLPVTRGAGYSVASALGGGGMSRAFAAEDRAFGEGVHNDPALHADWERALLRAHARLHQLPKPKG